MTRSGSAKPNRKGSAVRSLRNKFSCLGLFMLAALLVSTSAAAGPYTQIQILMPGETEAPGATQLRRE